MRVLTMLISGSEGVQINEWLIAMLVVSDLCLGTLVVMAWLSVRKRPSK